jgi:hypothetical protein
MFRNCTNSPFHETFSSEDSKFRNLVLSSLTKYCIFSISTLLPFRGTYIHFGPTMPHGIEKFFYLSSHLIPVVRVTPPVCRPICPPMTVGIISFTFTLQSKPLPPQPTCAEIVTCPPLPTLNFHFSG